MYLSDDSIGAKNCYFYHRYGTLSTIYREHFSLFSAPICFHVMYTSLYPEEYSDME